MSPSFLDRFEFHFPARQTAVASLLLAALISLGCGGASTATQSANSQLTISPSSVVLASGAKQQFTAIVKNNSNPAVTWSVSSGVISGDGVFVAPAVAAITGVVVSATSVGDKSNKAVGVLTIEPDKPLRITTTTMPAGVVGTPYISTLTAFGGVPPYRWSLQTAMPQGLSFDGVTGTVSGTPNRTGNYPVQAAVSDATGSSATQSLTLQLASAGSASNHDGPAELPRVYIHSSLADTPAAGNVLAVPAGGDLQAALNKASCGDTIVLQSGAVYTGIFTFPAKDCDDNRWIVLRSSAPDSALPREGTRMTPCYAGVSSLPGRPPLHCSSTNDVLSKLVMNATSAPGPVEFAPGANHYRLTGLEITRQPGTPMVESLASVQSEGTMDHIVFDRVWMHGTAQDETTRGVALGGSTYVSIVDSYFSDFHCVSSTGSCTDAQAISGGLGSHPMGPYKIVNNFLEAAAENVLFGGGAATVTPADIEIRGNHMFKPLTWMKGQAGYVGGTNGKPFIVKNLLELKNAQRVLMDGNIMDNSWGGFSQVGFAIVLTPKNQSAAGGGNLCPDCQVTDVTIRNGIIRHVASGLQIANALSDNGGKPLDGQRYSIHDLIIDDIDGTKYDGPGGFAQVSMGVGVTVLQNVMIDHVTAFPPSTLLTVGDQTTVNPKMRNFIFTNSIVNAGPYPVWSTGSGGQANCAFHDSPHITLDACFSTYYFSTNAIIASPSGAKWPSGNFFPSSASAVEFANYNGGNGGDYHLQPSSPYKGEATDGKDLGADVDAVQTATTGVE
jgi:hypothetical protein